MIDYRIHHGDCLETLRGMADSSVDAVVADPPYGLSEEPDAAEVLRHWLAGDDYTATGGGFMGKKWDSFVPGPATWREAFRVLKPGGYALVFAGSRTQDLMSMALRLAGFEIRDTAFWFYGSGFPKSLDVSKAIDKRGGATVGWFGPWLKQWREENGVKQKQVAALFPSKTGGMTGCVANWELGLNLPTVEQFNTMRHAFNLPFENMQEAEREIIGKQSGSRLAVAPGQNDDRSGVELNITTAHTDEAKQWEGWGTALKPAYEPIIVCRKPLAGTVADNVLTHGVGAINVDGCRVPHAGAEDLADSRAKNPGRTDTVSSGVYGANRPQQSVNEQGRWPANILHDGCFDDEPWGRYFYCAKASKADRNEGCEHLGHVSAGEVTGGRTEGSDGLNSPRAGAGRTGGAKNHHPTVKPTDLMRWCCRLVTPPGGTVLDPFAGSGSTGKAAILEGFNAILCEREAEYLPIIEARCAWALWRKVTDGSMVC